MMSASELSQPAVSVRSSGRVARWARATWTLITLFLVESLVFGLSFVPATGFWEILYRWQLPDTWMPWVRPVLLAMWGMPAYLVFAVSFMALSAGATRLLGWRTPPGAEMRIADLEWPLLDWARYGAMTHAVRVLVGIAFRATPLWTVFLRLNGARIGRGVFVNSLEVTDHCLLKFGDGVVIGANVHLSGHTVEGGFVKTASVKLGRNVTIGLGSVVGIGVEIGDGAQVGALSLVPKHRKLEGGATYTGIPVRRSDTRPAEALAAGGVHERGREGHRH